MLKRRKNHLSERRYSFPNRFQVFWRGIHNFIVGWRVRAVAERPVNHADSIPFSDIHRLLKISFCWNVRIRVKTRGSHGIVNLEEGEWVFRFYQCQYFFKAELCQQRLYVKEVEIPPPFLVEVTAIDGHEVDKKAMDNGA